MDPVVHFEIPVGDMERAKRFYSATFGWALHGVPGVAFAFAQTAPVDPTTHAPTEGGRVNGNLVGRTSFLQHPVVTIKVQDLDAALAKAQSNGASVVSGRRDVGPVIVAYVKDPDGNVVGLVQDKPGA